MKVVELAEFKASVQVIERPAPRPGPGQVRVRVRAATVNPVDGLVAGGVLAAMTGHLTMPLVLGWDVVGEIDAVGDGVRLSEGQLVAAMTPWFDAGRGVWAEQVVLDVAWLAPLPAGVDPVAAATVPLNGQTAQQSLDLLRLVSGQTVLITGASGGVGGFAVQLAAAAGHRVVAIASRGDEDRVRGLGAAEVLGRGENLVANVLARYPQGVDAVLDAVPVGPQLITVVRDGGSFVTTLEPAAPATERGVRVEKVSVTPRRDQLAALLAAVAAGQLKTAVAHQLPLDQAQHALELAGGGGLRGKVVLIA